MMTLSEQIFERFCMERGLNFNRIPEGESKSPDYHILVNSSKIIIEVKQIDANKEEKEILKKPLDEWDQYDVFHCGTPGDRIRKKIKDSLPRLKSLTKEECPTILVIYDNIGAWPELTDEYAVRVAMYGVETAIISPEMAPEGGAKILRRWYGTKKRFTAQHNTTLSAIAIMEETEADISIRVYHNYFAAIQLERKTLICPGIEQFEIEDDPSYAFPKWAKVVVPNEQM
jgi:hypothetical protein